MIVARSQVSICASVQLSWNILDEFGEFDLASEFRERVLYARIAQTWIFKVSINWIEIHHAYASICDSLRLNFSDLWTSWEIDTFLFRQLGFDPGLQKVAALTYNAPILYPTYTIKLKHTLTSRFTHRIFD